MENKIIYFCIAVVFLLTVINSSAADHKYSPVWKDLDTRPLPQWYDRAKIGIFLHWGVYSVPSFHSEWFWSNWHENETDITNYMKQNYKPHFKYQDFAPMFTAEFFNPEEWASMFAESGAQYIVLTSKHHEGFTLFPSKRSFSWNSIDVGPHRDLVGELSKAIVQKNLKFGLYHSLYEWFNPIYLEDKKTNFTTRQYVTDKLWPDLMQIINDYKPSVIWSDGDWEAYDSYWESEKFLAWLYNDSPVKHEVVVNDRWGIDIPCHHGDFYNCADRYNPGKLQNHKWENAFTIDKKSWGYRRNMNLKEVMTFDELLQEIVSTVSCGGNALINVGPTKEGTIAPIFQERLHALGQWLSINGEAIYNTSPWLSQNDSMNNHVWYTCSKSAYDAFNPTAVPGDSDKLNAVYAIILSWPPNNLLALKDATPILHSGNFEVQMLENKDILKWHISKGQTFIQLPDKSTTRSNNAWALKFKLKD